MRTFILALHPFAMEAESNGSANESEPYRLLEHDEVRWNYKYFENRSGTYRDLADFQIRYAYLK